MYGDLDKYPNLKFGSLSPGDTKAEMIVKHFPQWKTVCKLEVWQSAVPQGGTISVEYVILIPKLFQL